MDGFRDRDHPRESLRDMLAGMFTGEAGRHYWSRAHASWIASSSGSRVGRRFLAIVGEEHARSALRPVWERAWRSGRCCGVAGRGSRPRAGVILRSKYGHPLWQAVGRGRDDVTPPLFGCDRESPS
ncbi:DUF6082 family protein [Streptomyces hokutonensis]|uniref:DUF6082 family protein n=1 Tax=Streptomyces hokutonensis TaxID=1306990 RepID=UPI0033FF0D90